MSEQHAGDVHEGGDPMGGDHEGGDHDGANHDVHVYEGPGIEEGNAPVPKWYLGVVLIMGIFLVCYLTSFLSGVQPSAVQLK